MTLSIRRLSWLHAFCALLSLCPLASAQSAAVRAGSLEVGPFLGASYGIDRFRVMGGGNITYALNRIILPYFEVSYFPGIPHSSTDASGTLYQYSTGLTDVHGGVHIRIPISESRIVPYLVFGVGALHAAQDVGTVTPAGLPPSPFTFPSATSFAVNGGGGLRYYLGASGSYGFRAEAKVYKATSGPFSDSTIGKVEIGFFFQLR